MRLNTVVNIIILLVCLFFILSLSASKFSSAVHSIYHVTVIGAGSMDGASWENAAPGSALQATIDNAQVGDSVWVACGTYYPTSGTDRSIAFHMRNGVIIMGSFNGTESQSSQRVITCGPCTVLSGDIGTQGQVLDNTYTLVVNIGLDSTSVLDGFRVAYGYDNRSVSSIENGLGGGVYNGGSGAGGEGGICSPRFRNCVFDNNYAAYGAGMFNNGHAGGNSAPVLTNCIFENNFATIGGGGMDSYGWNNGYVAPQLFNCVFVNNTSADRAGAMYCWGGQNGNCSPVINSCAFINNTSVNIAGGIIVDNSEDLAGNPPFTGTAEVSCTNSIFWGNASASGAQFYILGTGHFTASHSVIDTAGQTAANPISGPGTGNIFVYPNLLDTTNALGVDSCWMTTDDGLSLAIQSPAINIGDSSDTPQQDLAFGDRISGTRIDIGPYEFVLPDSVSWTGAIDSNWFDGSNWEPARAPDSLQIAIIPGTVLTPYQPVVELDTACCSGLIIREDGSVVVRSVLCVLNN